MRSARPSPRSAAASVTIVLACTIVSGGCAARGAPTGMALPELGAVREFPVPWENAYPNDVALDSLGRVWFTDRLTHAVGMFDPATERFTRYETPTRRSAPYGIVTAADGGIWFAESVAQRLARIDPATGAIVEHVIDGSTKGPNLIAIRNGVIWFGLRDEGAYGSFDIASGTSRVVKLARSRPYGVAIAPDGTVWFGTGSLLAVDPRTVVGEPHSLTANVPVPPSLSPNLPDSVRRAIAARSFIGEVRRIATDRNGNVWITDYGRGQVMRYAPATRTVTTYPSLSRATRPYGIAVTTAGHVWYGEAGTNQVVVLDPVTEERRHATLATKGAVVRNLIVDEKRGRVWLPTSDGATLGLIEFRPAR